MLSEDQKRQAHIILYSHSRGGSAMVELARKLEKNRILVLLAVQGDSVRRFGVDDRVIPRYMLAERIAIHPTAWTMGAGKSALPIAQ